MAPKKPRFTSAQEAVIRDMERALASESYVYALRIIHANPDLACHLRAMWQKVADAQWEQELRDDEAQLTQQQDAA